MEHHNNNNSNDLNVNYEPQDDNQTNFAPITDPFAIPATESASISNRAPSITNRTPTPFQDLLADVMAASQVRSPPTSNNQTPAIQAQATFSSNDVHPSIDLNRAFDTNQFSGDASANSSPELDDVDHFLARQVVLGLLAATTPQERDEHALRAQALSRAAEINHDTDRILRHMQDYHQGVAASAPQSPSQPIIFPHYQFAERPFPASDAYTTNEWEDVDQVMVSLVHTLQADLTYLNSRQILFPHEIMLRGSLERILPASSSSYSNSNVAATPTPPPPPPILQGDFVEHWMEWQDFMEIDMSYAYAGIEEAVSTDGYHHDAMRLDVDGMTYEGLLELGERIGSVSSGATDVTMRDNMQHHKYGSSSFASSDSPNESCCICQEEYREGEDVSTLHCRHSYHFQCIKQWLVVKNSCPICKRTALPI